MDTWRRYGKQVPAGVLAMLLGLWVVSWFGSLGWVFSGGALKQMAVRCERSSIECTGTVRRDLRLGGYWQSVAWKGNRETYLGNLRLDFGRSGAWWIAIPIPVLITALLPLVVGVRTRFRYQHWHWLVLAALAGFELMYYVGWPT